MTRRKKSMKSRVVKSLVVAGLLAFSVSALAEEAKTGSVSFWEKTKVMGTLDVNYNYNFNRPTTSATVPPTAAGIPALNAYRVFDANANSFNVGLFELAVENSPNDWMTLRTDLDFGHDTLAYHAAGLGTTEVFDLQQAYVTLKAASIGNGLTFKIGKFVTLHGNEVIEASANNNVSRGLLFNYAIPFTHTGIMANYSFADWIALDLGVVNGWNNVIDNNNGKSIHGMLTIKPVDKVTWLIGGTFGPENTGIDGNIRALIDTTLTYAPTEQLSFALNYDLGRDSALAGGKTNGVADWQGVAVYAHWKPMDSFGLSLRGEFFKDDVGFIAPANLSGTAVASNKLGEGTLTTHWYLADGLDLRFELRHDQGNKTSFAKGSGTNKKFQDTIASQLVYSF